MLINREGKPIDLKEQTMIKRNEIRFGKKINIKAKNENYVRHRFQFETQDKEVT